MKAVTSPCPNCHYPNPRTNRVCDVCGAPLSPENPEPLRTENDSPPVQTSAKAYEPTVVVDSNGAASSRPAAAAVESIPEQRPSEPVPVDPGPAFDDRGRLPFTLRRRERGIAALLGAAVLLFIAVNRLMSASPTQGSSGPPAPASGSVIKVQRTITAVAQILSGTVPLKQPQEAVPLANGDIVVADTGDKRIVLLDAHGRSIRTITAGASPFQEPYAVAASKTAFYVLDTQLRAIESFDLQGRFRSQSFSSTVLDHPRGLALGPDGNFYIADPASSSIITASSGGTLIRKLLAPAGANETSFNQPSDVAIGPGNVLYVMDNGNFQVRALTPDGKAEGQLPAPGSSTLFSAHVLPLSDGRLLVSDPGGSLLLYPRGSKIPTRILLRVPGLKSAPPSPLGLASLGGRKILIADNTGGRILVVSLPHP
jgi:NHL repeat